MTSMNRFSQRSCRARSCPGERLIQETIASQIDVSRTPVREAFLRLEREGVLEAAGRGGFQIREITEKEIQHLYLAREAVEGFAAKLLAGALSQEQAQTIEQRLDRRWLEIPPQGRTLSRQSKHPSNHRRPNQ